MSGRVRFQVCPAYPVHEDGVYWVGVGRREGRGCWRGGCFRHSLPTTFSVHIRDKKAERKEGDDITPDLGRSSLSPAAVAVPSATR